MFVNAHKQNRDKMSVLLMEPPPARSPQKLAPTTITESLQDHPVHSRMVLVPISQGLRS